MPITILLADDHALVRHGLKLILESESFKVVGEAEDGLEAVRLSQRIQPDVAILDLCMPQLNGVDAAREIHQSSPRTRTVLLTARGGDFLLDAISAGMRGCLLKSHHHRDLVDAVRQVHAGGVYLSPGVAQAVVDAYRTGTERPVDPLSLRERQVLQLIAEGHGTKRIAELLFISPRTVESHRYRIMSKLEIRDTAGLVRYAISRGLCSLE